MVEEYIVREEGRGKVTACANCFRNKMFPSEGGYLDGRWFCCWACREALLKKVAQAQGAIDK